MEQKKKSKKSRSLMLTALVICMAGLLICLNYYGTFMYGNVVSNPPDKGVVKIYRSFSYDDVIKAMTESGVLSNNRTFLRAAKFMKLDENFKPGRYEFRKGMGNKQIVRTITHCWQKPINVSFNGYIRSMDRFAAILSDKLEADSLQFLQILTDKDVMKKYGFNEQTFPAMFIPNTYQVYWTVTPEDFVDRMYNEYEAFWKGDRNAKAEAMGLTRNEVSTLASIVIEETKHEPEMPRIAGVYINRLKKGMLLQADPTVKFALDTVGIKRILNKHFGVDSPYNTYKYKGLPPGPITIPPVCAIDAVLNYEHHNYLYFCANSNFDGTHSFSTSLAGHLRNAGQYHQALNSRSKAK